ncbi:hypothetical protein BCR43DRAFT_490148 [Syncephalastrum racemosum]|uniref:Uncharacterized protein n=1 Tax=Syncephalastrum racemosum TaxID=13706 RepID=A0A1X2HFG3_SYNRA|nr:hypothetical protein BCR43DRAFT_490148 [Syncephalastrum racemosum]
MRFVASAVTVLLAVYLQTGPALIQAAPVRSQVTDIETEGRFPRHIYNKRSPRPEGGDDGGDGGGNQATSDPVGMAQGLADFATGFAHGAPLSAKGLASRPDTIIPTLITTGGVPEKTTKRKRSESQKDEHGELSGKSKPDSADEEIDKAMQQRAYHYAVSALDEAEQRVQPSPDQQVVQEQHLTQ